MPQTRTPEGLIERIGGRLDPLLIRRARQELINVPVMELYDKLYGANFALEGLQPRGVGREVAWAWLENRENVERVAAHLKRAFNKESKGLDVISHWAICRTRALKQPQELVKGIRNDNKEAVVLIPLDRWSQENGLFVDALIEEGQDICVGGAESIQFPGTGGCILVMIVLRLSENLEVPNPS